MTTTRSLIALTAALGLAAPAAAALQLDFGDATPYVGTNTPGHEDGGISAAENTFTAVTADTTVAAFGTTVTVDLARNNGNNDSDAEAVRAPVTVTAAPGAGVFGTELTDDALQSFSGTANLRSPVAVEIEDLPDGDYTAYIVATYSGNTGQEQRVYAGVGISGQASYSTDDFLLRGTLDGSTTDSWVEGDNYSAVSFTIAGNQSLYILVDDLTANASAQTTLTSLQIVSAIPEPASLALLGLGGLMLLPRRKR